MSALTKLFVVMLIVCSLLLTAATVVFVNKADDFQRELTRAKDDTMRAELARTSAERDASVAREHEMAVVSAANDRAEKAATSLRTANDEIGKRDAELAQLRQQVQVANGNIQQQADALRVMGENITNVGKRNDTLTADNDKLVQRNAELVGANTDFQKRLDQMDRELRFSQEQLAQARSEGQRSASAGNGGGNRPPVNVPDLHGEVTQVKTDNGQTYATISLGAAEKVAKGMEFNVINQQSSEFLGKFIVDTVDNNSSFGRLEGPRIQDVRQGSLVLTRL